MSAPIIGDPTPDLEISIQGVWWLISREDWTKEGEQRIDPVLGSDPLGILTYAKTHFASQFMKRNRSDDTPEPVSQPGQNNTRAVGGYDAYFGTYKVDVPSGRVTHNLIGSVTTSNIGIIVSRNLRVSDDKLTIQLETTTPDGEPITRTLIFKRIS